MSIDSIVLVPVLAEKQIDLEGGVAQFYQAVGGLAQTPGNPDPFFFMGYRLIEKVQDEIVVKQYGAASEDMLDVFPEFEDLFALRGSWISGAPIEVFAYAMSYMGLTGAHAYDRIAAANLFRVQAFVTDELFCEIIKAIAESETPGLQAGVKVLGDFIEKQQNRWANEAASAIEAHELPTFTLAAGQSVPIKG
ncbi:hypothetical protein CcrBL47_gp257c [Caulobacter phage BL47]|nr:hypothetical protein CcrBL47_gp257c [Caulobacter phage BL47]